jgi:hypothetical protein
VSTRPQIDATKSNQGTSAPVLERHYTPEEIADLWSLSADTVRRLFEREPGVMVIERTKKRARRYRTLRIPESVALRVHRRMTNPIAMPSR